MSKYVNPRIAAEAEYKNAWRELFTVATGLEVPSLHAAVRRFRAASITLSVTPHASGRTSQRDLTRTEPMIVCAACGLPFPAKHPQLPGPQSPFCSKTCRRRVAKRRERALAKAARQVVA